MQGLKNIFNLRFYAIGLIAIFSTLGSFDFAWSKTRGCLINFERENHPSVSWLNKGLVELNDIRKIHEAKPIDIILCVQDGAEIITIIGHAGDINSENQTIAPLLYQKRLFGEEREQRVEFIRKRIDDWLSEYQRKAKVEIPTTQRKRQHRRILAEYRRLQSIPIEAPVYGPAELIENHVWQVILENPGNLKSLNIITCLPDQVATYYPDLAKLKSSEIQVKFAPPNKLMSFIKGKAVTSPQLKWIKESFLLPEILNTKSK